MKNELIISVSGLRGIVGDTLTPSVASRYAAAFAETLPKGTAIISRDGRANGAAFVAPVAEGLAQGGTRKVIDAGIAATPTTGLLVRELRCAGGVQISASHNPAEYNGLKLFSAAGRVVPAAAGQAVLDRFWVQNAPTHSNSSEAPGGSLQQPATSIEHLSDTVSAHLAFLERIVDVDRIRARHFRVLLDSNHGAGSVLGAPLLARLGCDVVILGAEPDGNFAHTPEPTAENLHGVLADVTREHVNVAFCQDPDADRLAIIDEHGRYIGEEYTLALCVDRVLRQTPGPVVTNCSTSRMTQDLAKKYHVPFFRSAVGEANVVDLMLLEQAVIGGEGNGGVIDPRAGLVRDSFVGMALVLDAMAERELPVSALADELPQYAIHKSKATVPRAAVTAAFGLLERHFADAKPDRLDGLRLDWHDRHGGDSWLLVRASNTEPIVRIIAEARNVQQAIALCNDAVALIERCCRGSA